MPDDVKVLSDEEIECIRDELASEMHSPEDEEWERIWLAALDAERAKVAVLTAERDELQIRLDAESAVRRGAINAGVAHIQKCNELTKALQALVESMSECWRCEELATHWRAGLFVDVNEEACSEHSDGGPEMTRASAIRAAVALLAKQRET